MFAFDNVQSFLILTAMLFVGELLSKKMRGMLPAVLVAGVIVIALVWSGVLPKTIVDDTGLTGATQLAVMLTVLDMGASTNLRQLWENRSVVFLSASSLVFQTAMLLLVVGSIFDLNTAVAGLPGGTSTAMIVQERARLLGYERFVTLSVVLVSVQNMIGGPLLSLLVRHEVADMRRNGTMMPETVLAVSGKPDAETETPVYLSFFRLAVGAWIAARLELLTGFSRYAYCLIVGVLLSELGFLKKNDMTNTQIRGFTMLLLMFMILSGFCSSSPESFRQILLPFVCVIVTDLAAITVYCLIVGRRLGFSKCMSVAIGAEIMIGFPLNMMIAENIIGTLTDDKGERAYLMNEVGTKLILAGFTSITSLSVVFASLLIVLMK